MSAAVPPVDGSGPRYLLNVDGACFDDLAAVADGLHVLDSAGRVQYRNENATAIAQVTAERVLIVAGPGSGKSHLFISRIEYWLPLDEKQLIYVATFVRKLVKDLRNDVETKLSPADQKRVEVSTLHTLARSLLARSGGTAAYPMKTFIRVIARPWDETMWEDVLAFHPTLAGGGFLLDELVDQFHTGVPPISNEWAELTATYRRLCQFYNAAGFAYLIVFAQEALVEQPELNEHHLWIIDEYQDFNASEDRLIATLIDKADGVLLAGDDEQALYQSLKASTPDIIIGHYSDATFAKAMLPFCSRCGFYICRAASSFMARHRTADAIDKIYLPLKVEVEGVPKVQVVATATPSGAVDYVRKFISDHDAEYQAYLADRKAGKDNDPFLLILSQGGGLTFSKSSPADVELFELVAEHAGDATGRSAGYMRVVAYFTAGSYPHDNFSVRKVLAYENLAILEVHDLISEAMARQVSLGKVVGEKHPEIMDLIRDVLVLVDTGQGDPVGTAADLAALLHLSDPGLLGDELAQFPIGKDAASQEDEEAIETAGALAPIALMTMIGSKGLSAHHVIMLGCDDMNMSYTTPLTFFVALTRARESLHLVGATKTGGSTTAHSFVYDLPSDCCDNVCYKKTNRAIEPFADVKAFRAWYVNVAKGQAFGKKKAALKKKADPRKKT